MVPDHVLFVGNLLDNSFLTSIVLYCILGNCNFHDIQDLVKIKIKEEKPYKGSMRKLSFILIRIVSAW